MNVLLDLHVLARLLLLLGAVQLVPALGAPLFGEAVLPYVAGAAPALVFGACGAWAVKPRDFRTKPRDGFVLVGGAWLVLPLFGAMPFVTTGILGPLDAVFESVAGFTTTNASVLPSVESSPRGLLLWRALTQWLGGFGVLFVTVALLPHFGVGGMQLFADVAGSRAEAGRWVATARRLVALYASLSALAGGAFWLAGMPPFDALCHGLTCIATGGFSTRDGSIGAFGSAAIEWVAVVFMLLGAVNFVHYQRLSQHWSGASLRRVLGDAELRYTAAVAAGASVVVAWWLLGTGEGIGRQAVFQSVSMLSGTGYHTADFARWPALAQFVLVFLMLLGGMTGSTTGGIKSLRLLLGFRALRSALTRLLHPHAVRRVKYADRPVREEVIAGIWAFLTAFFLLIAATAALLAASGEDLVTSISAAMSAASNVGPALGAAGPETTYEGFAPAARMGLAFTMIAGRLDVFPLLVLLRPAFWRR